jgi:hypothetical protein
MATVTGQRRTDNVAAYRQWQDLSRRILELEPESQPLTVFLNKIYDGGRRAPTRSPKFRWSEYELDERFDAIDNTGGYNASASALVVQTSDVFYPEALVKVPRTGEVFRVTSVDPGDSEVTVERGYGSAAAAAVNDGEALFVIGNAREEGDVSRPARSRDPLEKLNYTQIFKDWVEESGTRHSSDDETEPHDWEFQSGVKMIEHQKSKELSLLLGTPGEENGDHGKVRTTGGVTHFATENNVDANGTLTRAEFNGWLQGPLRYGKNVMVFLSRNVAGSLSELAMQSIQTQSGNTRYGIGLQQWTSAHGTVNFVQHPLLEGPEYGGYAIAVNLDNARYRYLNGSNAPGGSRDTQVNRNVQENDRDGRKDEILTECGLQLSQAKKHGVLTGVETV